MDNLNLYNKLRAVPKEAIKPIQGGRLKGMSDINPMFRIKSLTEAFGPVGKGWYYEIIGKSLHEGTAGEVIASVDIQLYVKYGEDWSKPIPGTGGSAFVSNEKNGPYVNDECFKMALTDALSVACKALGVGADVYWEKDRSKYDTFRNETTTEQEQTPQEPTNGAISSKQIGRLFAIAKSAGVDEATARGHIVKKFTKQVDQLTKQEYDAVCEGYEILAKSKKTN